MRILLVIACLACVAADWPQFLGPERNGVSTETGLLQTWPKSGPPLLWERKIGDGYSGPVVAGGRLIVFHRITDSEIVECLEADSGKPKWKFAYPTRYSDGFGKGDGPRAAPLIDGKRVYTLGAEGTLHCIDLEKGEKVWEHALLREYKGRRSFFGVGTSPIVEGDLLIVNVGGTKSGIVAFNKETGKEQWRATNHEASYSSPVAATIDGTRYVFFFTREGIVALNPADGAVRFSRQWRSRNSASVNAAAPLVLDDHLLVSASYDTGALLLKLTRDKPQEVWKSDEVLSSHYASMVRQGDYVYGFDGRQETGARLRCIDWKAGKVQWTKEGFGCGTIILADGNLIILTEAGELVLVEASPKEYHEKARAAVLRATRAPIALSDGRLFARNNERVICLNLKK
jgi:outer membrane protein assembly factor BamB